MQKDSLWDDIAKNLNKKYSTFSFLIEGDTKIVASKRELINLFDENHGVAGNLCLITGRYSKSCRDYNCYKDNLEAKENS